MEEGEGKNPVRALLFDMDNTLFDLVGAQMTACDAVVKAFSLNGKHQLYPYFLRPVHGYESYENIRDFMHDCGITEKQSFGMACRIYEEEKIREITPYPGIVETLKEIRTRELPMGIITDAHSRDAVRRLERSGLIQFFSCMVTYDLVQVKKPAHTPFLAALEMLRAKADQVLMVGDSPRRDIEPAKMLGFRTVYARYGDRFPDDRLPVRADYCLDSPADLPVILTALSGTVR
nr:HAD family hydrolase [Methanoregula sp. PtaU1.Bin006]